MPGTLEEKTQHHLAPFYDCFAELGGDPAALKKTLEVCPLGLMRGRTFSNAVAILTEAQNATLSQLRLFLTRIGKNAKLVIEGDPDQSDLRPGCSALADVARKLEPVEGVGVVRLDAKAIVRNPLIEQILLRV